jgi:RNA polymerase sigma-70 factor (ECF subfamily)
VRPDKRSGDDPWIRAAVSRYEGPLTLYAARILGDAERARDAVQEAFLRLCRQSRSQVEGHLAEWLYMVCRNCALDMKRKSSRAVPLVEDELTEPSREPGPDEVAQTREGASDALRLMATLSENQQEVLRLKFQHGLSYKQIVAITGLSMSNVGFLIHMGLKKLRVWMTQTPQEVDDGEKR